MERAEQIRKERERVGDILDQFASKNLQYKIMFSNLKKPIYLSYENIDKH
jgi:hypothetical protein